jgi:hypothetical protein
MNIEQPLVGALAERPYAAGAGARTACACAADAAIEVAD